jgi:glycine/D-amino acid oxidase-like deaminating enzyme
MHFAVESALEFLRNILMNSSVKKIVIVGGGTAGWLTAGILAAEYKDNHLPEIKIVLVESPEVSTIGVGEGTWPSMRATLRKIGISETDLITQCAASFKQGSKFVGWKNGKENDVYHHPFTIPNGYLECNLFAAWQSQFSHLPFADVVSVQSYVSESSCAPKQVTTPEYAGVVNYGYHLDAGKFGELLQRHCVSRLGVAHILDHVTHVTSASDGDINAIHTEKLGAIEGDLFIDCTGTACLLLGQHDTVCARLWIPHIGRVVALLAIGIPCANNGGDELVRQVVQQVRVGVAPSAGGATGHDFSDVPP